MGPRERAGRGRRRGEPSAAPALSGALGAPRPLPGVRLIRPRSNLKHLVARPPGIPSQGPATALTKATPSGTPTPVTLSQSAAVFSEVSVPKVMTNQRVENGLL